MSVAGFSNAQLVIGMDGVGTKIAVSLQFFRHR
ncbi:unnamed protein product [Anisakis simplex]|uniref:Uncharacterized protein n=1 Tax=Anisakis simplex TaxID=6269 RepID=A0A3P6NQQ7_ANISI|nr:unnamed protein product [Anisakis simplex]